MGVQFWTAVLIFQHVDLWSQKMEKRIAVLRGGGQPTLGALATQFPAHRPPKLDSVDSDRSNYSPYYWPIK